MSIEVFPTPSEGSSVAGKSYTLTFANVYKTTDSFSAGTYVITTSPTDFQAKVEFFTSNGVVTGTTVSGTVTVSLPDEATETYLTLLTSTTSTPILIITQTAAAINVSNYSGTLDTITNTSTYNQTGKLYVLAVGGGGHGGGSSDNSNAGAGGGGGSGDTNGLLVFTNTATAVSIGAAPQGTTSFGSLLSAAGGQTGKLGGDQQGTGGNGGGTYGGSGGIGGLNGGGQQLSTAGSPSRSPYTTIVAGNTGGGGGGGSANKAPSNGSGSGIGTGGNGTINLTGGNATGYGAGGGGGGARSGGNSTGGLGTQGVVYVLRGF